MPQAEGSLLPTEPATAERSAPIREPKSASLQSPPSSPIQSLSPVGHKEWPTESGDRPPQSVHPPTPVLPSQ